MAILPGKDIIDPILEKIDPTPNIFELFVQFNRRFFWGKLDMVEVAWSGRQMTSCAGICTFHPRSGHCTIKLSAPLLSLRSRKDMVETLLHEMIHAYLFMTKNYKDRNDHGPEFHKHMYRINKETGTNITVFHTFNDEVRSFQTHVWRCNGPCQKMGPFFGLVRRATNRAPGPNDTWWASHKMKCSGQFQKIEEPPGYKSKKKKGDKAGPPLKGIQNYFPSTSKIHTMADVSSPVSTPKMKEITPRTGGNVPSSNIHTLSDTPRKLGDNPPKFSSSGKSGTALNKTKGPEATIPYWFGSKPPEKSNKTTGAANVQDQLRKVWGNKFADKRKVEGVDCYKSKKIIVECDDCSVMIAEDELAKHRETCSQRRQNHPCPVCNRAVREGDLEAHLSDCLSDSITEDIFAEEDIIGNGESSGSSNVDCPVCGSPVPETNINAHIDECLTMASLKDDF